MSLSKFIPIGACTFFALSLCCAAQSIYEPYSFGTLAGLPGNQGTADGSGSAARFYAPDGVAVDFNENIYVADTYNFTIRKITPGGAVTTMAGLAGSSGSTDGNGSSARFNYPNGVAADNFGNVYIADTNNGTIRKMSSAGVVTTLAGSPGGYGSADGTGPAAQFAGPAYLCADSGGYIYVSDNGNNTIRKISPGGSVSTLAGLAGSSGSTDGNGSSARFALPLGIASDSAGNLYVADFANNTIRKISPGGSVSTLAGLAGSSGSTDGNGSGARFFHPVGVAVDSVGNVYVTEENHTVRKITSTGSVTTLAGVPASGGFANGSGSGARFYYPHSIAVDRAGNIYVADTGNDVIRAHVGSGATITSQPQSVAIPSGANATFNVTATGTTPLTYQWYFNGNIISGATSSTLTINNAQLASDAGSYSVVVGNSFDSVTSASAKLTVMTTPTATVPSPPYPTPPVTQNGKDSLVFITHGLTPNVGDESWIYTMQSTLANNSKVPSNWAVWAYPWLELSSILIPGTQEPDFYDGASRAARVGDKAGWDIINAALAHNPNRRWDHIHFIAHSAGAALVEEAAAIVKLYSLNNGWNTEIQITFLDPYTGFYDEWRNVYGVNAAWADDYFCIDTTTFDSTLGPFGRTDGPLTNAYSVDVTARDPAVTSMPFWCSNGSLGTTACRSQPYSTHGWPYVWYQKTIDHNNPSDPQYDPSGFGFPKSKEAGGAGGGNFGAYPPNTTPFVLGGSQTIIQGPINLGPVAIVNYPNIPNAISQTGTVQTTTSGFNGTGGTIHSQPARRAIKGSRFATSTSATGDPVWISVPVDTQAGINYVTCDLTFTSQASSAGLVTIYWNGEQIGFIDEQYVMPGTRTYTFGLGNAFLDKNNCLAFRLDEFSNVTSSISVTNVKTGFAGIQTPSLAITKNQSGNQIMSLTGPQGYTFLIQASTDLANWTPISNVSLDSGQTTQFSDPEASISAKRFYRALSP